MASNYGFGKTVSCAFDEAIQRVTAALQTEGSGCRLPAVAIRTGIAAAIP